MEHAYLLSLIMGGNISVSTPPYHIAIACKDAARAEDLRCKIEDIFEHEVDGEELIDKLAELFTDNKASYIGTDISVYNFFNNSSRHISDSKRLISDMKLERPRLSVGKLRFV